MRRRPWFHPWLAELALTAVNHARRAVRVWPETLFVGSAWIGLIALLLYAASFINGDKLGFFIEALVRTPWFPGAALAALGFGMAHGAAVTVRSRLHYGWWGVMPVPSAATERTVILVALLTLLATLALTIAMLAGVAHKAALWYRWWDRSLNLVLIAEPLGALIGYWSSRGIAQTHAERARRRTHGKPLVALPFVAGNTLAPLPIWQRTAGLRRWRSGGRWWQFVLFGVAIPGNENGATLIGLVMLAVTVLWLGLMVQCAGDVIVRSAALLAAMPLRFAAFARASFRYGAFAVVVATFWGGLALVMQGAGWYFVAAMFAFFAGYTALYLALMLRYRTRPRFAQLRLAVDAAALSAVAYLLGPVVIALFAVFLGRHLYQAARTP